MAKNKDIESQNKLVIFQSKGIRRLWHENEWVFSVIDIVAALTDSANPRDYWYKMKIRVKEEDGFEPSTVCRQLKDDLELIFTMLGERMTTEISKEEEPDTFNENKDVAKRGGKVAGNARKEAEKELGRSVISKKNYLGKNDRLELEE